MAAYVGRFAPSPTGPLHLGSLFAALASYLDAHAHQGQWLLRVEDIDPPREVAGAADTILQQLESHGLYWDGPVLYQSQRSAAYRESLQALANKKLLYFCQCPRSRLRELNGNYDGHCRAQRISSLSSTPPKASAIRVRVSQAEISWQDIVRGACTQNLERSGGDFVVLRRDGLFAYQLAVSIDDAYQGISHVIRGDDLMDSTPRQIYLLQQLGLTVPVYGHVPVIKNHQGDKLSKQRFAPTLDASTPSANLSRCLALLGTVIPADLSGAPVDEVLAWAINHWTISQVPTTSIYLSR